ncbi:MAG TPA: DUF547 domain-containing protein [Vicinamibacterales bacterium]|jgi:hypothetical protein|nr:DUF547 domain-containing protein [Vicinamibacterales bacterium]
MRPFVAAVIFLAAAGSLPARTAAQEPPARKSLDTILDTYVRDGFVYYRALKADRGRLDTYVGQLAAVQPEHLSKDAQLAFWLNAYNALVLQTVIDHYPIQGHAKQYPARSIRQIPGAFERTAHKVGGRSLTLDQIEQTVLQSFQDPRLYFAIARGSVGGGRLRSEAFVPEQIEAQLADVARECAARPQCVQVDREQNTLNASPIFSWREAEFAAAYGSRSVPPAFEGRSPIERAVLAFVWPRLLTTEKEFLEKNQWQMAYKAYDWTLNDLTGRGGR